MKSRIAIFEGYGTPFRSVGRSSMGRPSSLGRSYGRPTGQSYGPSLSSMGRRSYYVPERPPSDGVPHRRGYKVKAKRNTPAMKRSMNKFKKCARVCSKKRGARKNFPGCMRKCIRAKRSKR